MALITINGVAMPQPNKYSFPMKDRMEDDHYSESGELFGDIIRQGVFSIELGWTVKNPQAKILLDAIEPVDVLVTCFDPQYGIRAGISMRVGDRSCEMISFNETSTEESMWSISFSLTQL